VASAKPAPIIPVERIANRIYRIRGENVMLDADLAEFYGVPTKRLNEQNRSRATWSDSRRTSCWS
jgi:hypothetical protein